MKIKKLACLLMVIAIVVVISGCVGGGSNTTSYSMTEGAVIKDFSFDMNKIYDDESTTLSLSIENVGAKRIPGNTTVYIYGTPMTTDKSKKGEEWYVSNPGEFTVDDTNEFMTLSLSNEEFLPPDPEMGIPGTLKMFYVEMEPPNLPEGMTNDYTFYARLCYPYSTTMIAKITVTSSNELRYEGPEKSEGAIRNSAGPIHISLIGTPNIRPSRNQIPLVFKITNVGGGFPTTRDYRCTVDPDVRERGKVKVVVTIDGKLIDCGDGIVRLRNGEGTLYCSYAFEGSAPKTEYDIVATAFYNYYVTSSTRITVMDSMTDTDQS